MRQPRSMLWRHLDSWVMVIMLKLFVQTLRGYYSLAKLRRSHPTLAFDLPVKISFDRQEALRLGKDIYIGEFSDIAVFESSSFSPIKGALEIGDRVIIGKGANIRAAGGEIVIGENALLAQDVSLIAANHQLNAAVPYRDQPWDASRHGVTVGRNVWIGAGVTVLPGVSIGENSVIAAGAVVTRSIPGNQLWAGIPARYVRDL